MNATIYKEAQDAFIKMTGLKEGMEVRVMRTAKSHEYGWDNGWTTTMNPSVGEIIKVGRAEPTQAGIHLLDKTYGLRYPFFVLEVLPVTLPADVPIGGYDAKFNIDGSVSVGCQKVSYETLKNIYDNATKVKNQ